MIQIASDRAFLLILISVCLGACFVWAFWEIEEARKRRQQHRELARDARRLVKSGH
jgi:cbb3-type cytochrome oxidase subunit 3